MSQCNSQGAAVIVNLHLTLFWKKYLRQENPNLEFAGSCFAN